MIEFNLINIVIQSNESNETNRKTHFNANSYSAVSENSRFQHQQIRAITWPEQADIPFGEHLILIHLNHSETAQAADKIHVFFI